MEYVKSKDLNESFIGRRLHLDFGRKYPQTLGRSLPEFWDTILIEVNGKKAKFTEHRVDDAFNRWFNEQYLESVDEIEGSKLRITQFELLKINEKDISVKAFFDFFGKDEKILPDKSFTKEMSFEKKDIVEYLFFRKRNS